MTPPRLTGVAATLLTLTLLLLAASPALPESPLDRLGWLEGTWERQGSHGAVRETWQRVGPRTLEGEAFRFGASGREPLEQLLLVELGDAIFYVAMVPGNRWPVPFRLTESRHGFARFENAEHDFPQSLVYRLDGRRLKVRVEGQGDGFELLFERID